MTETPRSDRLDAAGLLAAPSDVVRTWLMDSLRGYLAGEGAIAFKPFEGMVGKDDFLAADVARIYASAPKSNQRAWRIAVADLIAQLPATEENAAVFDTLLDLVRLMPAYEVFDRAPARLNELEFGKLKAPNGQTLFERTLTMALDLSAQSEPVRDLLLRLAASDLFPTHRAISTFIAVCQADPDHWGDHLATFRGLIERMLLGSPPSERAIRRYAEEFLHYVTAKRVADQYDAFIHAPDEASLLERAACDDWLHDALFDPPNPLLRFPPEKPAPSLVDASRPKVAYRIDFAKMTKVVRVRTPAHTEPYWARPQYEIDDLEDSASIAAMAAQLVEMGFGSERAQP